MQKINKKLLLAGWACENRHFSTYQTFYGPLANTFSNIILFDPQKNLHLYDQEEMNKRFLELIEKEKPDYIFFVLMTDEFYIDTLLRIREISPKTKTVNYFGDDDSAFSNFTRYYAKIFDYCFILPQLKQDVYVKEGLSNYFFVTGTNIEHFKPLNLKEKYDVTFVGIPKSDRYELVRYLIDNGINIKLFGSGWYKYPDLKNVYGGPLDQNQIVRIVGQSKINLCFTKNDLGLSHLKGRVFEIGACEAFVLVENSPSFLTIFEEGKELVMFHGSQDLLNKIRYYLEHEKERKKIARNLHKKIIGKCSLNQQFKIIFHKIDKENKTVSKDTFQKLAANVLPISKEDLKLTFEEIKQKLSYADYISLQNGKCKKSQYKECFQVYSLEKSKKTISCCDYYLSSKRLGDYLSFRSEFAFRTLSKRDFYSLLDPNQLVVSKNYFLENVDKFKEFCLGSRVDLINEQNIVFVSIPLVKIFYPKRIRTRIQNEVFNIKFSNKLASLVLQNKLFTSKYLYYLALESLSPGKNIVLKYLIKFVFNKNKLRTFRKLTNQRN